MLPWWPLPTGLWRAAAAGGHHVLEAVTRLLRDGRVEHLRLCEDDAVLVVAESLGSLELVVGHVVAVASMLREPTEEHPSSNSVPRLRVGMPENLPASAWQANPARLVGAATRR